VRLFDEHRRQVEELLGRPLTEEDLVRRAGLADMSDLQRATARSIRRRQLVLCALYLKEISPAPGLAEATAWMADDECDDPVGRPW
jgi:hypothetical protein